jgi:hypothetical protein
MIRKVPGSLDIGSDESSVLLRDAEVMKVSVNTHCSDGMRQSVCLVQLLLLSIPFRNLHLPGLTIL